MQPPPARSCRIQLGRRIFGEEGSLLELLERPAAGLPHGAILSSERPSGAGLILARFFDGSWILHVQALAS